jgi:hypothetical protein
MTHLLLRFLLMAQIAVPFVASAQDSEVEKYVNSLRSVEQVKKTIRGHLTANCPTGSCVDNTTTEVCTLVAALDIRLGHAISAGDAKFVTTPDLAVTARDLRTFKLIWSQCKPTSYYYWNKEQVLHVAYDPDPRTDVEVRNALGIRTLVQALPPSSPPSSSTSLKSVAPAEPAAPSLAATAAAQAPSKAAAASPSAAASVSEDADRKLTQCILPEAQYGKYSSYDGVKSVQAILERQCGTPYLNWVRNCLARGDSNESCILKSAILVKAALKMFDK